MKKREYHGMKGTTEYTIWQNMRARIGNKNNPQYKDYGGRGIKVCDRWEENFSNFYLDMGDRPLGMTLDRRDNDGNYMPDNCRWANRLQQTINTRIRKSNTSGYRGITYILKNNRYQANVNFDSKRIYLGYFDTLEEAAYVRDQAAMQLHGKDAQLNFDYIC